MTKKILVTGATGLLGAPLVSQLKNAGFFVGANFSHDEKRALELQNATDCQLFRADVSDENAVETLFLSGNWDSVVHCAGWHQSALVAKTSSELWEKTLKIQLQSAFLIARASLKFLPRGGQLILVSSRVGLVGHAGQCAYSASKAGVLGLMKCAALEGKARGIGVNALCPGFAPDENLNLSPSQKLRREGENLISQADAAQSFAAFVGWFLASNSQISGQILRPDCRI